MRKLHQLAKELKENNFEMTDKMKEQFEEYLSVIAEGSRIFHPRFGLGTVTGTQGNAWVVVEFDRDKEEREKLGRDTWLYPYKRPVHITSCISIHMLIKKEQQREIMKDVKPD